MARKRRNINKIIEIRAGKAIYGGKCLSFAEDKTVMLERALPGELVTARVTKNKKSFMEAKMVEVLEPSPHRIPSVCEYYPTCGGCKMKDVAYDYQAELKEEVVLDCINRIAKVQELEYLPIVKSSVTSGYRNKMEFTFSNERYYINADEAPENREEDNFSLGFHAPRFYKKAIDIDHCYHQSENMNRIYKRMRILCKESGLPAYNVMSHEGFFRHLVLRETTAGMVMINLITKREEIEAVKLIADKVMSEFAEIKSFVNTINSGLAAVAFGEKNILIKGDDVINDTIGKFKFEISCNSFFQVNPAQTEKLYDLVADYADFKKTDNVLDLYCGVGTISIYVSQYVNSVHGFELVENAVINARKNAELNDITNCEFESGDLMKVVSERNIFNIRKFDMLITDPPRDGMHPKVVKSIINSGIKKIVYVSCNPSTFGRDVELLTNGGYRLVKAQAVDMFPNTYHVETIGLLELGLTNK